MTITLHNELGRGPPRCSSRARRWSPDRTGVGRRRRPKIYTFTADRPGTYLYEAGLAAERPAPGGDGPLRRAGRPPRAAGQAYDDASTAFDDEAVLVLSEIDPALNNAADPATFDMRKYAPRYFLVNGKALPGHRPDRRPQPASTVLLRYVNAGIQYHSMARARRPPDGRSRSTAAR